MFGAIGEVDQLLWMSQGEAGASALVARVCGAGRVAQAHRIRQGPIPDRSNPRVVALFVGTSGNSEISSTGADFSWHRRAKTTAGTTSNDPVGVLQALSRIPLGASGATTQRFTFFPNFNRSSAYRSEAELAAQAA